MDIRTGIAGAGRGIRATAFAVALITTALITTGTAFLFTATASGFGA